MLKKMKWKTLKIVFLSHLTCVIVVVYTTFSASVLTTVLTTIDLF